VATIGNLPSATLPTGVEVSVFTLLQWKHAIKLERIGLRHSSGRSVRKHAAVHLGLRPMAKSDVVLAAIEELLP
jgi:hypothetical protein